MVSSFVLISFGLKNRFRKLKKLYLLYVVQIFLWLLVHHWWFILLQGWWTLLKDIFQNILLINEFHIPLK